MSSSQDAANARTSKSGVRKVSPAEIFRSAKGEREIRKTADLVKRKASRNDGAAPTDSG